MSREAFTTCNPLAVSCVLYQEEARTNLWGAGTYYDGVTCWVVNSSGVITGTASCVSTSTLAWSYSETGGAVGEMRIYVNSSVVETRENTSSGTWTGLETGDEIYVQVELLSACSGFDDAGNVYSTSNRGTLTDAACFVASTGTYTSPTYTVVAGDIGSTITLDTFASCESGCL